MNNICLVKMNKLGRKAMAASLLQVFHQLKTHSRPTGLTFTRSINTSAVLEKETFNAYSLITRRSHFSNHQGVQGENSFLNSRCVIWSQVDLTSVRKTSYFEKYSLARNLESKGFTGNQAECLTQTITTKNDENEEKLDKLKKKIDDNIEKMNNIQTKIDEEFENLKWKSWFYTNRMEVVEYRSN